MATAIIGVDSTDIWTPKCEDWQRVSLDLSSLQGQQVIFQFQYSKFENGLSLYLDNINLQGIATTAVEIASQNAPFQVYPNPNNGNFQLIGKLNSVQNLKIEVQDAMGRKIYQENLHSEATPNFQHLIRLPQITAGWYILTVRTDEYYWTERLHVD